MYMYCYLCSFRCSNVTMPYYFTTMGKQAIFANLRFGTNRDTAHPAHNGGHRFHASTVSVTDAISSDAVFEIISNATPRNFTRAHKSIATRSTISTGRIGPVSTLYQHKILHISLRAHILSSSCASLIMEIAQRFHIDQIGCRGIEHIPTV